MNHKLLDLLLNEKIITQSQHADALSRIAAGEEPIRHLIKNRTLSETKLLYFFSQKFGLPSINLSKFEVGPDVLRILSLEEVRKFKAVPIQSSNGIVVVAVCDPTRLSDLEDLKFKVKMNIETVLTTYSAFDQAVERYYGGVAHLGEAIEQFQKDKKQEAREGNAGGKEIEIQNAEIHDIEVGAVSASDAPVIAIVNSILREALMKKASDIHIEPFEKQFRVRMRVDGMLNLVTQIPVEMKRAVVARIKIMSRMDIAESRLPQDGRIKLKTNIDEVDIRVNTIPTVFGEKVVMRILNAQSIQLSFGNLGFEMEQLKVFKKSIEAPNGMVLVTGPTGSGKTTTLYTALAELNKMTDNISTVEDPVEYNLDGINQVQVHKDIGLTFASVLRSLLRQDPDIILLGEIRDYETAEVAIQAAMTGHLVLSTLHTNDSASSITRLMNMGIEPFLVVASLNSVIAQRLIRKICLKCKMPDKISKEQFAQIGVPPEMVDTLKPFVGKGCKFCGGTGFKGRVALYEVLDFTTDLKEMVLDGCSAIELKRKAVQNGMKTLRTSALAKVVDGVTSLEEAMSVTMEG